MSIQNILHRSVSLKELTTFEIGGQTAYLALPENLEEIEQVRLYAQKHRLPIFPIGGGSNILAADSGFSGLVLRCENKGKRLLEKNPNYALVYCEAGVVWDDFVAYTVAQDLAGIECLSGIPGRVGAAPVQNIGAYGQEVASSIESVDVLDLTDGTRQTLSNEQCAFAYRFSNFKHLWRLRYLITAVTFRLIPNGRPTIRYGDLSKYLSQSSKEPTLAEIREAVLTIRARKSMTYNEEDPNHRCAGSFFLNPSIPEAQAKALAAQYPGMPTYPSKPGTLKLAAAWLLEQAGFTRGFTYGRAGLSTHHVLALINTGGACSKDIQALSDLIISEVEKKFSITLVPEPIMLEDCKPE